jgi:hypothetical protein
MWFASKGATVCWPIGHSPDWDLVVEWNEKLYRVQVKTTTQRRNGRWLTMICTGEATRVGAGCRSGSAPHGATSCSSTWATDGAG